MKYSRTKSTVRLALLLLPAALIVMAGTPWSNKGAEKWTPEEIERLLTDSPWAQQTEAIFRDASEYDSRSAPAPLPGPAQAGMGGRAGATDGHWDGGVGRMPRGGTPHLPVLVRWNSALPIREALARSQATGSSNSHPVVVQARDYVIAIVGLLPARQGRQTSEEGTSEAPPTTVRQSTIRGLLQTSRLSRRKKPALVPTNAKLDYSTGEIRLFFSKSDPITLADKEVTFTTQFGSMKIEQKFRLKDMVYQGKLAL